LSDLNLKNENGLSVGYNPRYYEVRNIDGLRYCHCGSEKDAISLCEMHPGFTYVTVLLPPTPKTVDVPYVRVAPDFELPMQQVLPQSELEPFITNYHD